MTTEEFSNEFDVLINSFQQADSPLQFDEYEKSVFLTKAQEDIVINLYNGKLTGESFEQTEQLRRDLASLIRTEPVPFTQPISQESILPTAIFPGDATGELPPDLLFIIYDYVDIGNKKCGMESQRPVIPVTHDEVQKIRNNPFRGPTSNRVLRLDIGEHTVELLIPKGDDYFQINEYIVRYLAKPDPIILTDLPDGLSINNTSKETKCKLNPVLHRTILELAVNQAIKSRVTSSGK